MKNFFSFIRWASFLRPIVGRRRVRPSAPRRPAPRARVRLEPLEPRILLSSVTVNSPTPTNIPIGPVKAGDTIVLKVNYTTKDVWTAGGEQNENEHLFITPSAGKPIEIPTLGQSEQRIHITQKNETVSAYINNAIDGGIMDDSATIQPGPTVRVEEASTTDSKSLEVTYDVENNDAKTPFLLKVYRSSDPEPGAGGKALVAKVTIGEKDGKDAANGTHTITIAPEGSGYSFSEAKALRPDPTHRYVLVTADEGGTLNPDDKKAPPSASFRIWLIGGIAHGYVFSFGSAILPGVFIPPYQKWVDLYTEELQTVGHYDAGIPEHWEYASTLTKPNMAVYAGEELAMNVIGAEGGLDLGPNDVVDVNLIGYSRGAVVVGQALQDLCGDQTPAPLLHGFMVETLIDPHPANKDNLGHDYSAHVMNRDLTADGKTLVALKQYKNFQAKANDPVVVVPAKVQAVGEFYQNTPASAFPHSSNESILNLWGMTPSSISPRVIPYNTTQVGQGHGEMQGVLQSLISSNVTLAALGLDPFQAAAGGDPLVVTAEPPSAITAGIPFGLAVTAENANGSVNTSFNGTMTVADGQGKPLGGTLTVHAVHGVATFTGLTLDQAIAEDYLVVTSSDGLPAVDTEAFSVTGPASHVVLPDLSRVVPLGAPLAAAEQLYGEFVNSLRL